VPISSYSIDGGDATIFNASKILRAVQYRRQFFQSNVLTAGSHTLVITTLADNAFFVLDYFEITRLGATPPTPIQPQLVSASDSTPSRSVLSSTPVIFPTPSPHVVASSITTSSGITTAPSGISTAPSGISTAPSGISTAPYVTAFPVASSKAERPLGPIIGGALGGLALLIIGFIAFMFFRRANDRLRHRGPTLTTNPSCKFSCSLFFFSFLARVCN